ncbi:MAG TPA: hypothetical protein VIV11_17790 [Kofleriaceae bacterium]
MSTAFHWIELAVLHSVTGGKSDDPYCPDAADIYGTRAAVGAVDTANRLGNAADAAARGDIAGAVGNTAGAVINGISFVGGLLSPPETPVNCDGLK